MGLESIEFRQIMHACQNHHEYLALTGRFMPKWQPIIINDVATDLQRILKEKEGITAKVITEYPIAELGVYGYRSASREARIFLDKSLPYSVMMPVGIHEALELARKAKRDTSNGSGFIEGGFMQKPEEILIEHDVGKLLYSDINGSVSNPSKKDETKQLPSYHFVLQEHSNEIVKWIGKSSSNYDIFNIEVTVYGPLGQHYGTIVLSNGHLDCLGRSKGQDVHEVELTYEELRVGSAFIIYACFFQILARSSLFTPSIYALDSGSIECKIWASMSVHLSIPKITLNRSVKGDIETRRSAGSLASGTTIQYDISELLLNQKSHGDWNFSTLENPGINALGKARDKARDKGVERPSMYHLEWWPRWLGGLGNSPALTIEKGSPEKHTEWEPTWTEHELQKLPRISSSRAYLGMRDTDLIA